MASSARECARQKDVYIIQPTCTTRCERPDGTHFDDQYNETSSASRIAINLLRLRSPRQKNAGQVPISAAEVARMLEAMGDRVVAVDLHCGQIQGFSVRALRVITSKEGDCGSSVFSNSTFKGDSTVIVSGRRRCPQSENLEIFEGFRRHVAWL